MKDRLMKPITGTIAISMLVFCALSCKSVVEKNEKLIVQVENLMWQKPDSALAILNMADTAILDKHQKAVYTLLYTQATDKTDGNITAHTGIFRLREYFDRTGNANYAERGRRPATHHEYDHPATG